MRRSLKFRWRRGPSRRPLLICTLLLLVLLGAWCSIRPSSDRDWVRGLHVLPKITFAGDIATIDGVRNIQWRSLDDFDLRYEIRSYDLASVESLWFCLSIFNPDGWRGPAHSLLSFGFADGRYLAISVEARREMGERYSIYRGLLKRFELMYVIGDEADLIASRAALRPDSVRLYPIAANPATIRLILRDMLEATNALHDRPEFYNTLTNNCTTRLRDHVNDVVPGRIPHSWKVILPGYADELLERLGLIDAKLTLDHARRAFEIKAEAIDAFGSPDFSTRIRAGLPVASEPR